ncbi:MAG: hypothetical protein CMJ27_01510 [Phycisphaerae bacterium]|nr:hypothetical protein [Phycisphaerae bacterium]OUX03143.1 MAG: hypothetical protein CBD91_00950 [Phycisphaeraceae bacterium TMED231]
MEEQTGSSPEAEAWRRIVEAIVAGTEDPSIAGAFWVAVEARIWSIVLSGRRADPGSHRVRSKFRDLFADDVAAAEDFVAELAAATDRRRIGGLYRKSEFLELERDEMLQRIAARSFVRKRAVSFVRSAGRGGMVGLPEGVRGPGSFDSGPEGGWGGTIEDRTEGESTTTEFDLLHRLLDHEPVLRLELRGKEPNAVEMTAALHTWLLLDSDTRERTTLLERLRGEVVGGVEAVEMAIRAGWEEVRRELAACDDEVVRHPGMERKRLDEIDRRRTELQVRWIFEPLSSGRVRELLGLPSLNAGEKRNSNYRSSRTTLFPLVDGLLSRHLVESEASDE